jgi:hypothetical protein
MNTRSRRQFLKAAVGATGAATLLKGLPGGQLFGTPPATTGRFQLS